MIPYLFFFFISIAGLAYGTYTDFKERMISNWITYGMIVVGIAGYAIVSFIANDWLGLPDIFLTRIHVLLLRHSTKENLMKN